MENRKRLEGKIRIGACYKFLMAELLKFSYRFSLRARKLESLGVTVLTTTENGKEKFVSFAPEKDIYIFYSDCAKLNFWDWQIDDTVWSKMEKERFKVRVASRDELRTLDSKYDLLKISNH